MELDLDDFDFDEPEQEEALEEPAEAADFRIAEEESGTREDVCF